MKESSINFRCSPQKKDNYQKRADQEGLSLSKYIVNTLDEKGQVTDLISAEVKFLKLFEEAFKIYYEPYHHKIASTLRVNELNVKTILEQNNFMYKNINLPQEASQIKVPLYNHPITDLAREKVIKEFRSAKEKWEQKDE
jgi:hypothetical protein